MTLPELPFGFVIGICTLVGLCVGSFLNVLIYRTPEMMALTHASRCPSCDTRLNATDLVPLASWLFLRGKCAHCNAPISARYPLVELVTALLWAACAMQWQDIESAVAWSIFCSGLLSLALIDWDTASMPDSLIMPLMWSGLVASTIGLTEIGPREAIWGAALGYGLLWLVLTSTELATEKIGMHSGDLKLLAAIGAWLGPVTSLTAVLFAGAMGAAVATARKTKSLLEEGAHVSFGPFLSCAAIILLFFGKEWLLL